MILQYWSLTDALRSGNLPRQFARIAEIARIAGIAEFTGIAGIAEIGGIAVFAEIARIAGIAGIAEIDGIAVFARIAKLICNYIKSINFCKIWSNWDFLLDWNMFS